MQLLWDATLAACSTPQLRAHGVNDDAVSQLVGAHTIRGAYPAEYLPLSIPYHAHWHWWQRGEPKLGHHHPRHQHGRNQQLQHVKSCRARGARLLAGSQSRMPCSPPIIFQHNIKANAVASYGTIVSYNFTQRTHIPQFI